MFPIEERKTRIKIYGCFSKIHLFIVEKYRVYRFDEDGNGFLKFKYSVYKIDEKKIETNIFTCGSYFEQSIEWKHCGTIIKIPKEFLRKKNVVCDCTFFIVQDNHTIYDSDYSERKIMYLKPTKFQLYSMSNFLQYIVKINALCYIIAQYIFGCSD